MTKLFHDNADIQFDDVFAPNLSGTYAADSGFRGPDGSDLSRRYEHISFGSKHADVNHRTSAGIDVSNLWAAKGTAVYALGFNGKQYIASGARSAAVRLVMNSDGKWYIYGYNQTVESLLESGTWLPSGASVTDYQVKFAYTDGANGSILNGAPALSSPGESCSIKFTVNMVNNGPNEGQAEITCTLRKTPAGTETNTTCEFEAVAAGI